MAPVTVHHEIDVAAEAATVYDLIAGVERWPLCFPPTVYARRLSGDDTNEVIELWALANGTPRTWTSQRILDAANHRVVFWQQTPRPPVASMGGSWRVEPTMPGRCRVVLTHDYAVVDDDDGALAAVARAVDTNSNAELVALKRTAERSTGGEELQFTFEDSLTIDGDFADVYEFVRDCGRWPDRIPHVRRLDVEEIGQLQVMTMDTAAPDGSVHTTRSTRVCFPLERIVYKQTSPPEGLATHIGEWSFRQAGDGVEVTSRHSVVLDPVGLQALTARGVEIIDPRGTVRRSLGANSLATMTSARSYLASQNPQ
jgi:aromatase